MNGVGPIALIVCTSSVEVENMFRLLKRFLRNCDTRLKIITAYGMRNEVKVQAELLNGCDILLVTQPCLSRLLNGPINLFDINRIEHLVIDNIDIIYDRFSDMIQETLKHFSPCFSKNRIQVSICLNCKWSI